MYSLDAYVSYGAQKPSHLARVCYVMRFIFLIPSYENIDFNKLSALIPVTYFPLCECVIFTASGQRIVAGKTHRSARCVSTRPAVSKQSVAAVVPNKCGFENFTL